MKRFSFLALSLLLALLLVTATSCGIDATTTDNGGKPSVNQATNYGIGYGYDVINSPYFYSSQVKKSSILDLSKAAGLIEKTQESSSKSGSIYAESISDYASQYEEKIGLGMKMDADFSAFTQGLGMSFDIDLETFTNTTFKSTEHQIFYTYYDNVNSYYVEMKNYSIDSLRAMLSKQFVAAINRETSETRNLNDQELAAYLFSTFGTHLITGVQLGGRIEYSYLINTTSSESAADIKIALQSKFGAQYSGVEGEFNLDVSTELNEKLSKEGVEKSITIRRFGGESVGLWTEEQIIANYADWAKSLNDERYMNAVGIAPQGVVSLWSVIPDDPKYTSLVTEMQNFFHLNGLKVYESNIEKYLPIASDTIVVDMLPCYDNINKTVDYTKLKHPFFHAETGVFEINGSEGGEVINKYIFRGGYGVQDDLGRTIDVILKDFSLLVYAEHDITIELQNMAFSAPAGQAAITMPMHLLEKQGTVTIVLSGETKIYGGDGNKKGMAGGAAILLQKLQLDVKEPAYIQGGKGGFGADGNFGIAAEELTINFPQESLFDGTYLTVLGGNGGNGTGYGAHGGNGAAAIAGTYMTVNNLASDKGTMIVRGGNGGNGVSGEDGDDGRDATLGIGTSATDGEDGGDGGNGGNGARALMLLKMYLNGSGKFFIYGGNGGKAGNGGDGGDGGQPMVWGVTTDGGRGGSKGQYGFAGFGVNVEYVTENVTVVDEDGQSFDTAVNGKNGTGRKA